MDPGTIKFLLPQIPSLANTALWHSLGRTDTSSKWDLRTAITVQILRRLMNGEGRRVPVSKVQRTTVKTETPVQGKTWIAKATIPAPSAEEQDAVDGLRASLWAAIDALKPAGEGELYYTKPPLVDVEIEWTKYRPNATKKEPLPDVSEQEKYKRLMAEPTDSGETTVLYFHGGAYWLCDPVTHRPFCSRLAKECNGRVCSVRYRLAPQTAFPGQLLDAFMVYLGLQYPPPGSIHEAVPASHIVFAGDSAGGNLSFALLQLLLQIHRSKENPTVRFHGQDVKVLLPAGVTGVSPWLDVCRAMPSIKTNIGYDYLPPPNDTLIFGYPDDKIWPTTPPRGDLFCDLSLVDHPLVSPVAAADWHNSPPLWISTGKECLEDEARYVATAANSQGVPVQFEYYDAMPHVFAAVLPHLANTNRHMRSWGDFCRRCVEQPGDPERSATFIDAKSGKEEKIDMLAHELMNRKDLLKLLAEIKARRIAAFEDNQTRRRKQQESTGSKERAVL